MEPEFDPADFSADFEIATCVLIHEGELLLLKRSRHEEYPGYWCLPGGRLDAGDAPLDAVRREVAEETGIELSLAAFTRLQTLRVRYPEYDFTYHVFGAALGVRPSVVLDVREHSEWRLVPPAVALTMDLVPGEARCLESSLALSERF